MNHKVNKPSRAVEGLQEISNAVSERIKSFRKARRFSQDELSRIAGISKGMLVELEKGSANPSIAILCKLATALGLSVADIVNISSTPVSYVIDKKDIPVLWEGDKGGSARLLAGTQGPDMIELWRWEMFPGERFDAQPHSAGTVEILHVESGELGLLIDKQELVIQTGCSAVARTDVAHSYFNSADDRLIFTMAVAELIR